MPRPPPNPQGFDKVNYVIDAWTTGCDAPWYIYIETMKPALLTAFITLITFGWDDVLRGALRPRGLYKRRTGKRKGKWSRRVPRFPELGNTLGKNLPVGEELRGRKWHWGVNTLWRIDGGMEMVRFFWLVAAIAEDFAFDWTSVLYESYWCQPDPPGQFSNSLVGPVRYPGGYWWPVAFPISDYANGPPTWGYTTGSTGNVTATVTTAINFVQFGSYPLPETFEVQIWNPITNKSMFDATGNGPDEDGNRVLVVSGALPPFTSFQVRIQHNAAQVMIENCVVLGREVKD